MASAGQKTGKQRARSGLIAAYALVLALVVVSALLAFGAGSGTPKAAEPAAAPVTESEPEATPPRKSGTLKLPPKPPSSGFRTLPPAETAGMIEVTADGQRLPRISASGWMPWIANSRRFDPAGPPARMGLLMIDVGVDEVLMQRAIDDLPGEVSLAFLPGTPDLPRWLRRAHERGHEAYLMLPVEDPNGPAERGIKPITISADPADNLRRLRSAMARGDGYVGFVVRSPGPVSQSEPTARPLIKEIAERGLALIEINPTPDMAVLRGLTVELGVGYARSTNILDYKLAGDSVAGALDRLVTWLGESGADRTPRHVFGVLQPDNHTIDAIVAWHGRQPAPATFSLVPIIGHFECRHNCMTRLSVQPAQLRP
ncbi:MAG: divergent polysaccharide deacetylase family protein [Reyranella sp.]|nr:divergent polysaccharide deacetylase family protein [Reyranella sp.]